MSGLNGGYSAGPRPPRRIAARLIGTAIVGVLLADGAVALADPAHTSHHRDAAPVYRPLADIAPAPAPVTVASVAHVQPSSAAHRAAQRRLAAAIAAQAARNKAARSRTHPTPTSVPSTTPPAPAGASRLGTVTHTVRSTATTPGVKPGEVGTMTTGGLVSGTAPKKDLKLIPALTYLATMRHRAKGFASSTAKHPNRTVPRNWYGRTSVLPIVGATKKRVLVRLARRPNESTSWIRLSAVNLGYSQQAILIDLSQRRLYVFRDGKQKYSFPIGIGRPQTPTPTGTFFLAFHAPPNGPTYGSVMLETSGHSTVFRTFEGGDDAIIAIHGPIGSDAAIGTNGAVISNGCIRMHNSQLIKASHVEDGSPIIITR